MKKVVFLFIVFATSFVGASLFIKKPNLPERMAENRVVENQVVANKVTPTPFPFIELTIPYLSNRKYVSKLDSMEKTSENSSYISYRASYDSDGLRLYGQLTVPKSGDSLVYPAIVFVHGYIVPQNYRTETNYSSYVDYLAKRGFVVFKIDLRGHDRSEGDASGAYYSGDYVIDTLNAYSALQAADFVNPARIGLWGHSMAGNIVLRSVAAKKDIPAAVIWAGAGYTYTDILEYGIDDNSYRPPTENSERARKRRELTERHGLFNPESSFWKQVPATNFLKGIGGAIQLNHAQDDYVVSIDYSKNLMKILDSTDIIHELKEYKTGGHNLTGASFTEAMENTATFFNKYLK